MDAASGRAAQTVCFARAALLAAATAGLRAAIISGA
jgi:hypothetical protein